MKTTLRILLSLALLTCLAAWAQDSTINPQPSTSPEGLPGLIANLVARYPWLATLIFAMGSLRLVIKPIMLGVEYYAKSTPNPNDDVAVLKFQSGPLYKWLAIGLDFVGSIKLASLVAPPPKK